MPKTIAIDELVRSNIRNLKPYRSARDDYDKGTLLDANENSYGSPIKNIEGLNRYPSPYQWELRSKISELRGVRTENVFVGVGSDEAIDLLYRIFCEPGRDRILITPPTYGMYSVSANIHNIPVDQVLLTNDFDLDPEAVLDGVREDTKMTLLCSPNNPTGNDLSVDAMKHIASEFHGIVVIDEAYVDFSDRESLAKEVAKYPNMVVMQTLSKAFGLAGIRLGIAIAAEDVIQYLLKVKAPYNVNSLTSHYAIKAFENLDTVRFNIDKIKEERDRLSKALSMQPFVKKVYPSDANFLLFKVENAFSIYKKLADRGVIVRYRGNEPKCDNCLRVTVGMPDENDLFLSTLKEVIE
ncbi:histidinol-phosphate transaminase [Aliifodinibius sp. S!AR15-10]|uniref:histidinol-phosphate transaminase n=1 Tax=Aliifodinibius sp. S!AR15-10 TaxID=2950437 RepID=UPI00285BBF37|nr:histidinol-phosphate transaminase [Aliifodinibius sp. S!AR15-10]MDR8394473.1 histidinol-phosphate transaminase [Aliifodinibius sp. S!AR15-10]